MMGNQVDSDLGGTKVLDVGFVGVVVIRKVPGLVNCICSCG